MDTPVVEALSMSAFFDVRAVTLFEGVPGSGSRALYRIANGSRGGSISVRGQDSCNVDF